MSFLSPIFLLGLAALAAPILVHLVRRTRAKRVPFASIMFVRRIPQRTIRRKRLRDLILLALRCLAMLLIILAFTRPYFSGSPVAAGKSDTANVVLIDDSFSMGYANHFAVAKARARKLIDDKSGEQTALLSFGNSYDVLTRFTSDHGKLQSLLDSVQTSSNGTDYEQALQGAQELFKESRAGRGRIYLISDFQATGWNGARHSFQLNKNLELIPVDVGEQNAANLAVTDIKAQPLVYQQKYPDKLTARIENFGEAQQAGVQVTFKLNDHVVEKREVTLKPNDGVSVEFTDFNLQAGINRGEIEINGDNFTDDNARYFTLNREQQSNALLIETANRAKGGSLYLKNALTTGDNLPFTLVNKTAGATNPAELSSDRIIILNDVGNVNGALADQLKQWVEKGGGLIIATGPQTTADEFNRTLAGVAPVTLRDPVELHGAYSALTDVKMDHPIFEVFRQSGRLAAARVYNYHRSEPRPDSAVLASYADGSPALIEGSIGQGKVILFTSTLDATWNDLPLTPLYLPLIRQLTHYLGERDTVAWHAIGQPVAVPFDKNGQPPAIDAPKGSRLAERTQTAQGDLLFTPHEQGFYHLRYADRSEYLAVNLDSKESDLTKLDPKELIASLAGKDAQPIVGQSELKRSREEIESNQRVWWSLLLGALALFVIEAIIAQRTRVQRIIS